MHSFNSPITKQYVEKCIAVAERLVSNSKPLPSGADLVGAIQSELMITNLSLELPPVGVLGLCVNIITIVRNDVEDPIEFVLKALIEGGV